jgi:hypothetical protein
VKFAKIEQKSQNSFLSFQSTKAKSATMAEICFDKNLVGATTSSLKTLCKTVKDLTLSKMSLNAYAECLHAECHFAQLPH